MSRSAMLGLAEPISGRAWAVALTALGLVLPGAAWAQPPSLPELPRAPLPAPVLPPLLDLPLVPFPPPEAEPLGGPSNVELDERLQRMEELIVNRQPNLLWSGYIDFGFFAPEGDGVGYVQDFGHARRPEYAGRFGWVFLGDILAPVVNTRGEAADLGQAPGVDRFDSVHSRGAPGFILNETNLVLHANLTPAALITASVDVVPRTGNEFRLGDVIDLDLAQLEWLPTASQRTSIFVGKMDSVLGIEYRERKSNRRFGITPSLIARYTVGTALGLKLRSKFGREDWLVVAGAVTNGSNVVEQFHFYSEIDTNAGKTVSGRVSVRPPWLQAVEVGLSGSWGAQDRALASGDALWFLGVDLQVHLGPLEVKAQWLEGESPGDAGEGVYALDLRQGAYLELDFAVRSFGLIARGELRDALVWLGNERLYLTKSWRATGGARWSFTDRAVLKVEYLRNGEYGGLPAVANDVFTSSLVLSY